MLLLIASALVSLLVGVGVAFLVKRSNFNDLSGNPAEITRNEFLAALPFVIAIALVVTIFVGPSIAQSQAASGYKQFFNGSVTSAQFEVIECFRDGSCVHSYSCDPYQVEVPYTEQQYAGTDSKGNSIYRTVIKYRTETRYHDCPYATMEFSYWLQDSLGGTTYIESHNFADNPVEWRKGSGIPGSVSRGVPKRWLQSKTRLEAGDAEPVTRIEDYKNYILASQEDLLKQFSGDIESYKNEGLLVPHTVGLVENSIMFDYGLQAKKVQFVGVNVPDESTWQSLLMQLNAAVGMERQGDIHMVIVPASKVSNPDAYINSLVAYWQADEYFGKWGLPKNAIAIVIGVDEDNKSISWARAKTGMPFGNGEMISAVNFDLQGKPFDPMVILGTVKAQPFIADSGKTKVRFDYGTGLLSNIVLKDHPFQRACMDCEGEKNGSFVYLESTIPISPLANFTMLLIVLVISLAIWVGLVAFSVPKKFSRVVPNRLRLPTKYRRY